MPSVSEKQRKFMGARLAEQRKTGHNSTGMSEEQLGDFAKSRKQHGSLEDITFHEEADENYGDVVCDAFTHPIHKGYDCCVPGALDPPAHDDGGGSGQFSKNKQSCNRDIGHGLAYGAPVDYFGPDTDYRAEEIDPSQYGRSYEPYPLRDYFKTGDKVKERDLRLQEQDAYDTFPTPGVVTDEQPMSEAYGAVNYRGAGPNLSDGSKAGSDRYRSFDSQIRYLRANKDAPEYDAAVDGLDTKLGKDIK
jgi:hypothetical protein